MSNKVKNTDKETIQQRKVELIKKLDGKIANVSRGILEQMTPQDLQTIADNLNVVNNVKTSTTRSNISTEVVEYFTHNNLDRLKVKEVIDIIRRLNLGNYFTLPNDYDTDKAIELINIDILLGKIKSNQENDDQAERQSKWIARANAYLKSHLIGETVNGCLFKNKDSNYYFVLDGQEIVLTEKTAE